MEVDLELIRKLCAILREEGLSELTVAEGERRITLKREPTPAEAALPLEPPLRGKGEPAEEGHIVRSPLVGIFWRRPNPDSPPFVKVGDRVEEGQTLCVIESMKVMNEIRSDVSGRIEEVLVEDGTPVEYGQPLFRIATE